MTRIVVMGVTGSGKSTIGSRLASLLDVPFADADDFHSPDAIEKMGSGSPLDDADRGPWLAALAAWLAEQPRGAVLSCSALRRRYRDLLRTRLPDVVFVHLVVDPATVEQRLAERAEHFMPSSLIASQFEALEGLAADEGGLRVDATLEPDAICEDVVRRVRAGHV